MQSIEKDTDLPEYLYPDIYFLYSSKLRCERCAKVFGFKYIDVEYEIYDVVSIEHRSLAQKLRSQTTFTVHTDRQPLSVNIHLRFFK